MSFFEKHNRKYLQSYASFRRTGSVVLALMVIYIRIIAEVTWFEIPLGVFIILFIVYTIMVNAIINELNYESTAFAYHKIIFFLQITHAILLTILIVLLALIILILTFVEYSDIRILSPIGIDIYKVYWRKGELVKIIIKEFERIQKMDRSIEPVTREHNQKVAEKVAEFFDNPENFKKRFHIEFTEFKRSVEKGTDRKR